MLKQVLDFVAGLNAAMPQRSTQTITGKIVSIAYFGENQFRPGKGLDEKLGEARSSVKWEGMPAAIVTSDGTAYQIIGGLAANNNAKIIDYLGQTVTITGDVSEMYGMKVISSDSVSK